MLLSEKKNITDNNYENWVEIKKMTNASFMLKAKVKKDEGYFCGNPGSSPKFFIGLSAYLNLSFR